MRQLAATLGLVSLLVPVIGSTPAHPDRGIAFDMPAGWVVGTPSSSMRVAEFTLPRAEGDSEDAALVVYFFGGSGGTIQANLDRWVGQITQPDGSSSADAARTSTRESSGGLKMTLVDVSGTYVAEVTPGSPERFNNPGFRLRAAVIETADGPYFVKLTGPQATVARWDASYQRFLASMRPDALVSPSSWPSAD